MSTQTATLLDKQYDGESIADVERDVYEAFDGRFTPAMDSIPTDAHGISKGTFTVTIKWELPCE